MSSSETEDSRPLIVYFAKRRNRLPFPMTYSRSDLDEMERFYRANFVNSLPGFKSTNLIGTIDPHGQTNCTVFSSVIHLGSNPPLLGMNSRPRTAMSHTLHNIEETGFYTINHVNHEIWQQAHQASARYERDQSEFDEVGLHPEFTDTLPAPYVRESRLKIGMKFVQSYDFPNNTIFIIGEIIEVHLDSSVVKEDGYIDIETLGSIANTGLDAYHQTEMMGRLSYAKVDRSPERID